MDGIPAQNHTSPKKLSDSKAALIAGLASVGLLCPLGGMLRSSNEVEQLSPAQKKDLEAYIKRRKAELAENLKKKGLEIVPLDKAKKKELHSKFLPGKISATKVDFGSPKAKFKAKLKKDELGE